MSNTIRIDGAAELQASLNRLGRLPAKSLSAAVRAGAKIVRQAVKAAAPKRTGALRRAITTKMEKSRKKGKKVAEVTYSAKYTDQLAGVSPGTGNRYYYPSSMEYGFMMRNGQKWPGLHFMKKAAEANQAAFDQAVVKRMTLEIDKEWAKTNGA